MKQNRIFPLFLLLAACFVLVSLAACAPAPKSTPVTGAERDTVLAYTEPIVDNLLKGMNEKDYATFSRDFDPSMKKAMDEKAFNTLLSTVEGKIGKYQSRTVQTVERFPKNVVTMTYNASFEKEDNVTVRVSFHEGNPPQVAGIFFTSPKLRGQ